ncbi:MAG: CCA tRNA nucleotidyltransferase [Clostridia bacterium]|nr:CCA tRNA nucleotidyltransferase [Clostridia bacterium]
MTASIDSRISNELRDLARIFEDAGFALFCVGGCVRDWLLERDAPDTDLCSKALPEQVLALLGQSARLQSEKTATVSIEWCGCRFEHTSFRTESYGKGGEHTPQKVEIGATLEEDAFRRDFTVNALYYDITERKLIDPTGGMEDLRRGMLRTTSKDPSDILKNDGLRLLRLVRFAHGLNFEIEENTRRAAREYAHLLEDIAFERKRDELTKILLLDDVTAALYTMDELGLFPYIIPELTRCKGFGQRKAHHIYDVMGHLFHAVENIDKQAELRYMALLHDIGKPECLEKTGNQRLHHEYSARTARVILERLRLPKSSVERIVSAIQNHMFDLFCEEGEDVVRQKFCLLGVDRVWDLIALREADVRGSGIKTDFIETRWRRVISDMVERKTPFSIGELALSGGEIMATLALSPCAAVGELQKKLLMHCATHPEDNEKQTLKKLLTSGEIAP